MSFFDYTTEIKYPIFLEECNTPAANKTFKDTINNYHSYVRAVEGPTRRIKWLIRKTDGGDVVGAYGLSSAVLGLSGRDEYIGWDSETKMKNLGMVANNFRFCIIPNNGIKNLGSMSLKLLEQEGKILWKKKYNQELCLLETFVEPCDDGKLYREGSVYKAANWIDVGMTSGNSIQKAPLALWKKEDGARGELARTDPKAAVLKYGYKSETGYDIGKSSKKIILIKPTRRDWKTYLLGKN